MQALSSIHDWEVEAEKFSCETSVEKIDATTAAIHRIDFTCNAEDIKSHKRIMENKMHEALKEKEFPQITFKLKNPENIHTGVENVMVKGKLTIAGKTKEVQFPSVVRFTNETNLSVTGEIPLKLSDFNIEPPTAMMGALKTGYDIKIKYNFEFYKTSDNISKK